MEVRVEPPTGIHHEISKKLSDKLRLLSFVSAALVILIHVPHPPFANGSLDWWCVDVFFDSITRIAVPYFFFASGLLLFRNYKAGREWYTTALKKRVQTLIVPFFMSNLLAFLIYNTKMIALGIAHGVSPAILVGTGLHRAYLAIGLDITRYPLVGSLWFIRNLFILVVLSPLVYWFAARKRKTGLAFLAAAFLLWASPLSNIVFFRIGFSLEGMFWFAAGAFFSGRAARTSTARPNDFGLCGAGASVDLRMCAISAIVWFSCGIAARTVLPPDLVWLGKALSIAAGFICASEFVDISLPKLCRWCESPVLRTAFFIYLYQFVPLFLVDCALSAIEHRLCEGIGTIWVLGIWIAVTTSLVFTALFLEKKCPRLYKTATGGR